MGCTNSQLKNIEPDTLPPKGSKAEPKTVGKKRPQKQLLNIQTVNMEDDMEEQEEMDIENQEKNQPPKVVIKTKFDKRRQIEGLQKSRQCGSPAKIFMNNNERKEKNKINQEVAFVTQITDIAGANEQNTFIDSIMQKSRSRIILQNPAIPHQKTNFLKPIVEYPKKKTNKCKILPNQYELNKSGFWDKPISTTIEKENQVSYNESYLGLNQPPKSPAKSRIIDQRIHNIKIQSCSSIQSR